MKSCFLLTRVLVVDTVQLKITLWLLGKTHFSKMPVLVFLLDNCTTARRFLSRVVSFCGAGIWREDNRVTLSGLGEMLSWKWKTPLWRKLHRVFIAQDNKAGVDLSEIIKPAPKGPGFVFLCHFCCCFSNSSQLRLSEIAERN